MIIYKKVKIMHLLGNRYRIIVGDMTVEANFNGISDIIRVIDNALEFKGRVVKVGKVVI